MSASGMSRELERVQNWDRARALLAAMGMSLATLQPHGTWNTTIELKINFVRPAIEGRLRAIGRVIEMRQTLLFGEADVVDDRDRLVARASSTCMPVPEGQGRE
ncbi:MAG: PaaI family thioesterase [Chloroflexi bacterium]|nr:MAG: PaaI family thioesterase [Chloroflexota bacterium]